MSNPLNYDNITIYGGNVLYDYVWVKKDVVSQDNINTINSFNYIPQFDGNTILLAPFSENINGGNIVSLTENVVNWSVYRKKPTDTSLTFIAKVSAETSNLIDYNTMNDTEYQYVVFAETTNTISAPLTNIVPILTDWYSWSIVDLKSTDTKNFYYVDVDNNWVFNCSLSSSELKQNVEKYAFSNFTQFPKIAEGKTNYITTGITAYLGDVDEQSRYSDTIEMQNSFKEFINNGNLKLLKDRKGNGWVVSTMSNEFKYDDNSVEQATTVNFTVTQVNDIKNINAIEGV